MSQANRPRVSVRHFERSGYAAHTAFAPRLTVRGPALAVLTEGQAAPAPARVALPSPLARA